MADDEPQWFLLSSSIWYMIKTLKTEIMLFNKRDLKWCNGSGTVYIWICWPILIDRELKGLRHNLSSKSKILYFDF